MRTERRPGIGSRLLELAAWWFLPRLISLPLLVVLALFRGLRFERGLAWLRRGGVGLFLLVLVHSGIAHAADHYAGHDPAEEFMRQSKER